MGKSKNRGELLEATCVPSSLGLNPPWEVYNLRLAEAGTDETGAYTAFTRIDPGRAGNLCQICTTEHLPSGGRIGISAVVRATGADAAGLNVYLYTEPKGDNAHKVYQVAHPGDGAWHTIGKEITLPKQTVHRIRVMLVHRSGEAPVGVRDISLHFFPETTAPPPNLARLHVSAEFHEAVLRLVDTHPAAGDPVFRDSLYRSLIGGNEKGIRMVGEVVTRLAPAGFSLQGKRFLDLGSGTGGSLMGAQTHGAAWCEGWEINSEKLALSRLNLGTQDGKKPGIVVHDRNMESADAFPADGEPFDLVFCQVVLEHVKDINAALATMSRCIHREQGVAFVTVPNGYALECVLADPHLRVFGLALLDRFEAQPVATALKNHTHYSLMMGSYYRYSEYIELFVHHGLEALPLHTADTSTTSLQGLATMLETIRQKRASLRTDWAGRVDDKTLTLLELRLDAYLSEANTQLTEATAAGASSDTRLAVVHAYGTGHLEFFVAHRGSRILAGLNR